MFHNSAKTYLRYDVVHIVISTYHIVSYDAFVSELRISNARFSCAIFHIKSSILKLISQRWPFEKLSSKGIRHLESGENRAWHSIPNWNQELGIIVCESLMIENIESGIRNRELRIRISNYL
jgi:hypothetical protein